MYDDDNAMDDVVEVDVRYFVKKRAVLQGKKTKMKNVQTAMAH